MFLSVVYPISFLDHYGYANLTYSSFFCHIPKFLNFYPGRLMFLLSYSIVATRLAIYLKFRSYLEAPLTTLKTFKFPRIVWRTIPLGRGRLWITVPSVQ